MLISCHGRPSVPKYATVPLPPIAMHMPTTDSVTQPGTHLFLALADLRAGRALTGSALSESQNMVKLDLVAL